MTWTDADRRALADACREHDRMMEEAREGQGSVCVQRDGSAALEYRVTDNSALPAPETAKPAPSDGDPWNSWFTASFALHTQAEREVTAIAIGEVAAHERAFHRAEFEAALVARDRRIGILEGELRETEAMLSSTLKRLEVSTAEIAELSRRLDLRDERDKMAEQQGQYIADLRRQIVNTNSELQRKRIDDYLAERDARFTSLETRVAMLLNFIGGDLPRGWGTYG